MGKRRTAERIQRLPRKADRDFDQGRNMLQLAAYRLRESDCGHSVGNLTSENGMTLLTPARCKSLWRPGLVMLCETV